MLIIKKYNKTITFIYVYLTKYNIYVRVKLMYKYLVDNIRIKILILLLVYTLIFRLKRLTFYQNVFTFIVYFNTQKAYDKYKKGNFLNMNLFMKL